MQSNMDEKMVEAARTGNVQLLNQLLVYNPSLLTDHSLNPSSEHPLTIAIKSNQLTFATEILMCNSQLALVLNQDGTRPLDVAAAYGHVEIVKEILMLAPDTCRLTGRDGRTAIHYASMNGNVEIMNELLSACSDCAKDVTAFGETCLHLAVKFFRFKALEIMLQWLEKIGMVDLVNSKDMEGNSVLHHAASRKQLESVKLILEWNKRTGNKVEVNATNKKGMTPLDILDISMESSTDIHLRTILLNSGAFSTSQIRVTTESPERDSSNIHTVADNGSHVTVVKAKTLRDLHLLNFKWDTDSPGEARGTLVVVLALLATISFQAGINPPDYLTKSYSIVYSIVFTMHMMANTAALFTSGIVMGLLTDTVPFSMELKISFIALAISYLTAAAARSPADFTRNILLLVAIITPRLYSKYYSKENQGAM